MSTEMIRVLEMVAEGKLTVEDANRLISALDEAEAPVAARPRLAVSDPPAVGRPAEAPRSEPSLDELIQLHHHGVDADFVREMREAGFRDLTPPQLIALHDHGVDADFIAELREVGFGYLSVDELIQLQNHGVDADFVREMRGEGVRVVTPDDAVRLRSQGVEPDDLDELRRALNPSDSAD